MYVGTYVHNLGQALQHIGSLMNVGSRLRRLLLGYLARFLFASVAGSNSRSPFSFFFLLPLYRLWIFFLKKVNSLKLFLNYSTKYIEIWRIKDAPSVDVTMDDVSMQPVCLSVIIVTRNQKKIKFKSYFPSMVFCLRLY